MDKKSFVVAAIPAFNEEKTIAKVVLLARKCVEGVVVCDDGSMDLAAEIAERLGADVMVTIDADLGLGNVNKTGILYNVGVLEVR